MHWLGFVASNLGEQSEGYSPGGVRDGASAWPVWFGADA